jgi:hypothetical protein
MLTDKSVVMFKVFTRPSVTHVPLDVSNQFPICRNIIRAVEVTSHTVTHTYPLLCAIKYLCCCSKRDNPSYIACRFGLFVHSFLILDLRPVRSPVSKRTSKKCAVCKKSLTKFRRLVVRLFRVEIGISTCVESSTLI